VTDIGRCLNASVATAAAAAVSAAAVDYLRFHDGCPQHLGGLRI